jgi:DNA repair exonuclease SbcCD nuclease subunit
MRYILLSDLHLTCDTPIARKDNIEETWKRKLMAVFRYSVYENIPIIVAGDFFDKPRDWKTLSEFIKLLNEWNPKPFILSVFGQHDMYLYSKNREQTSLGILINSGLVTELGVSNASDHSIYGCSWGQEIPKPDRDKPSILVIHRNISDAPLFPGHEYTNAEMFLKSLPEYQVIVCGDIHKRFFSKSPTSERIIVNPGPLLRMEATEYNMGYVPKFAILDTDFQRVTWVPIPHEPSEVVLTRKHIENKRETENMLDEFIKNVSVDHKITFSFKENLQEYLTTNSISQQVKDIISEVINATGTD